MKTKSLVISNERITFVLRQVMRLGLVVFGLAWSDALVYAAPGDLDPSFGTGGKVITDLYDDNITQKMAIQPDGKIVVEGYSLDYDGYYTANFLVRYNPNGTLDTNFGTGGTVIISRQAPSLDEWFYGLAVLPDGKILVGGSVYNPAAFKHDFAVFRFNTNGSRDISFGTNGVASASVSGCSDDRGYTLQVQPDDKIVVLGTVTDIRFDGCDELTGVGAARFNTNGTIDTAFGTNGKLTFAIPLNGVPEPFHFAILPDGKLLLIGRIDSGGVGVGRQAFLGRINGNGTLDASFGTNGILLPVFDQPYNAAYQFALQPDGKIVFPTTNLSASGDIASTTISRLNPNGTPDTSFGTNGTAVIPASEGRFSASVVIQPNGKILTARTTTGTAPFRFAIVRLNADGSRDSSFGTNGIITTLLASYYNEVIDLALPPDGKLIACGVMGDFPTAPNIGLARYLLSDAVPGRMIGGRVLTPDGRGLRNATVSITDSLDVRRTVTTSSYGFYSFDHVADGQMYTIGVSSRLYRFASRAVQVDDNLSDLDFTGVE